MAAPVKDKCPVCGSKPIKAKTKDVMYCPSVHSPKHKKDAAALAAQGLPHTIYYSYAELAALREDKKEKQASGPRQLPPRSSEQDAVYNAFVQMIDDQINWNLETRCILVNAYAGTGKTTLLEHLVRGTTTQNMILVAFNRDIRAEMQERIIQKNIEALTSNAMGRRAIIATYARSKTEDKPGQKLRGIVEELIPMSFDADQDALVAEKRNALFRMYDKSMSYILDIRDEELLVDMAATLDIDERTARDVFPLMAKARERSVAMLPLIHSLSEQIWAPSQIPAIGKKMPKQDIVAVDEAQDLALGNQLLIELASHDETIVIIVGDIRQAIYAWRGADAASMSNLAKMFGGALEFDLTLTRRCSIAVTREAQMLVGDKYQTASTEEGSVSVIATEVYEQELRPGDMVLARTHAFLVPEAFKAIRMGIPVNYLGRDIGANITGLITQATRKTGSDDIGEMLVVLEDKIATSMNRIVERKLARANTYFAEEAHQLLVDRVDIIRAVSEQDGVEDTLDIIRAINELVNAKAERSTAITFGTGYGAKGLESERVFIVGTDKLPHPKVVEAAGLGVPGAAERLEQEFNLIYVMITRAIKHLFWVGSRPACMSVSRVPQQDVKLLALPAPEDESEDE